MRRRVVSHLPLLTLLALLSLLACAWPAAPAALAAQPLPGLTTGFTEPLFQSDSAQVREEWLSRAAQEHAGVVRLNLAWAEVERLRPPSQAAAENPSWEGYDWSNADSSVGEAAADGLRVQLTLAGPAPQWAEGAGRPKSAPAGTWRPDPGAYAAFAHAAARRYSGAYTPPGASRPLPRVRYWQAWNEPNLSIYLTPQWRHTGRHWLPESPAVYRPLLDAFYRALKGVQPDALVLSAGTAPYGDPPGGQRMPPAQFVRNLLCLDESGRHALHCGEPARFDILDHHPYSVEGPFFKAYNRDDVAIADMGKLTGPLRRAERLGTVSGARHHQVWVTELSWDSSPPDPHGVPAAEQARWLEQAFALLWREGVSTVMWYLVVDQAPIPSYAATYQSGVYLRDGRPKPSATAFRFPFVLVGRPRSGRALFWGKAPGTGPVTIEALVKGPAPAHSSGRGRSGPLHRSAARHRSALRRRSTVHARPAPRWRVLRTLPPGADGVFQTRLVVRHGELLRARQGAEASLGWRTT